MMRRRTFLGGTLTAAGVGSFGAQSATAPAVTPAEPLVWPVVTKLPPDICSFAGHTDTVPDIVGRIGTPAGLVIFTEGNHLMVLLSDDIIGAFPSWAKSQPQYADLDLDNIVVVTVPQPIVVQMMRTGGIALGNLMLEVSRKSGFYPDVVMAGPEPLRQAKTLWRSSSVLLCGRDDSAAEQDNRTVRQRKTGYARRHCAPAGGRAHRPRDACRPPASPRKDRARYRFLTFEYSGAKIDQNFEAAAGFVDLNTRAGRMAMPRSITAFKQVLVAAAVLAA